MGSTGRFETFRLGIPYPCMVGDIEKASKLDVKDTLFRKRTPKWPTVSRAEPLPVGGILTGKGIWIIQGTLKLQNDHVTLRCLPHLVCCFLVAHVVSRSNQQLL